MDGNPSLKAKGKQINEIRKEIMKKAVEQDESNPLECFENKVREMMWFFFIAIYLCYA